MRDRENPKAGTPDPYSLHRLALAPLHANASARQTVDVLKAVEGVGLQRFFDWLWRNGLSQVWRAWLEQLTLPASFEPFVEELRAQARLTAAHQMLQDKEVRLLHEMCGQRSIPFVVLKGADLRASIYDDPVLRPVSDIDVLVPATHRDTLIGEMTGRGYALDVRPETASHEVSLVKKGICIDLHWHLLRPGRARAGLTDWLFAHREEHQGLPGLDATASLLVMLVHPAITKYLLSPTSMLIHQVDQARLLQGGRVDWTELEQTLTWSGTKTMAWSSLYVLRDLSGIEAPGGFTERIQPGSLQRGYLRQWIDRAWITRWFDKRRLVAGLFSLALQDGLADVIRALTQRTIAATARPLPHCGSE